MQNLRCPMCGCVGKVASVPLPPGCTSLLLVGYNPSGSFSIPPNGIVVDAKGCANCGSIFLGSPALVGAEIVK